MNTSSPFAASPTGAVDIVSEETAQQNQKLEEAVNKIILEFYPVACKAASLNLSGLLFLCDQLAQRLPDVHPLERARALYTRLVGGADEKAVSQAFSMGSLVATALRK